MSTAVSTPSQPASATRSARGAGAVSPGAARTVLALAILAAVAGGLLAAAPDSAALADPDLTRLLRAMAVLKALMAAGAVVAIAWRLGVAVTLPWLGGYAAAGAAMAAGPVLIWDMAHVGLGAGLLHGGLLAAVLLLWRDKVVGARLSAIVAARRPAQREAGR